MDKNAKKRDTKQWRVGEYLRLSKEDETSGTSLSIENQKAVIHDFMEEDTLQFSLVETYIRQSHCEWNNKRSKNIG